MLEDYYTKYKRLEREMEQREIHHFEAEQALTNIKHYVEFNQEDGDGMVDASDILSFIPEDIK